MASFRGNIVIRFAFSQISFDSHLKCYDGLFRIPELYKTTRESRRDGQWKLIRGKTTKRNWKKHGKNKWTVREAIRMTETVLHGKVQRTLNGELWNRRSIECNELEKRDLHITLVLRLFIFRRRAMLCFLHMPAEWVFYGIVWKRHRNYFIIAYFPSSAQPYKILRTKWFNDMSLPLKRIGECIVSIAFRT